MNSGEIRMDKIILIGSGGSGKSTLARQLGERLHIGVYHLDQLFWKPGWVGVPKEEQKAVQQELVKKEKWIIDGNYGGTMDIRLQAADTIIFLDMPRMLCMYNILKRQWKYRNTTRPDMGAGKERLDLDFVKWVWRYPKKKRPGIISKLDELSEVKKVLIFTSQKDIKEFLKKIS
jgi:adenylate kinase family enzyme